MDKLLWLDLNWNLVALLIMVVVSIIAIRLTPVAGTLLLTLVLYLGVDWNMWSWVIPLFWIAWSVGLVFVIVTAVSNGGSTAARFFTGITAFIVAALLIFTGIGAAWNAAFGPNQPNIAADISDANDDPAADEPDAIDFGPQRRPDECVDGYNIVLDENLNDRLISGGVDVSRPNKAISQVVTSAKHDPRNLQIYFNSSPLGKKDPVKNVQSLVDNGCFSAHGRDIWNQTYAQYKAATVKTTEAPRRGINTFVDTDRGAYQESGVITGDRRAVKVTFQNGDTIWVLKRCGNVVTDTPIPHLPPPTNNPPVNNPPTNNPPNGEPPTDNPPPPPPCEDCEPPPPCKVNCNPPPNCPPGQVPHDGRCIKAPSDDGVGGNNSPANQPVNENPQGPTPGAGNPPPPPNPGPPPQDNSPAPDPTPGGYDSGSNNGSGTPGGSTCDGSGCDGGGPTPAQPGPPPVVDDGTHSGDPGGF